MINFKGTDLEGTMLDTLSERLNQFYTLHGFRFGICMPSTCTAEEIGSIINRGSEMRAKLRAFETFSPQLCNPS